MPDWDLMERIEDLLAPYRPDDSDFEDRIYSAYDGRGTYDAAGVEELREEAAKQEEPPNELGIYLGSPLHSIHLRMHKGSKTRAILMSEDEAVKNHVAARLRELFALAAIPEAMEEIDGASFPVPGRPVAEREWRTIRPEPDPEPEPEPSYGLIPIEFRGQSPRTSFWAQHFATLIVGILVAVVSGLILALIL